MVQLHGFLGRWPAGSVDTALEQTTPATSECSQEFTFQGLMLNGAFVTSAPDRLVSCDRVVGRHMTLENSSV